MTHMGPPAAISDIPTSAHIAAPNPPAHPRSGIRSVIGLDDDYKAT